jgi:hypothetical protein
MHGSAFEWECVGVRGSAWRVLGPIKRGGVNGLFARRRKKTGPAILKKVLPRGDVNALFTYARRLRLW